MIVTGISGARANALLSAVPRAERAASVGRVETIRLSSGDVLHDAHSPMRHVYFPTGCVISLLAKVADHPPVAVAMVGSEGVVGISVALGDSRSATRATVQGSGTAVRMTARACSEQLGRSLALRKGVLDFTDSLFSQLAQTASCIAFHPLEARLSRWLLMTRDRSDSDQLELTQELLAQMLGVRRVGVTVGAGNLRRLGIISYARGRITILDHARLVKSACECYTCGALPRVKSRS